MSQGPRPTTRATVAVLGATAVVVAELAALALSTRLSVATLHGSVPAATTPIPVVTVSVVAVGLAVAVHRRAVDGTRATGSGVALIVAAPVTAFGGGCTFAREGITLFRSGVRIGVAVGPCVTFFNGALLVVGYGLFAAGLWLAADRLRLPAPSALGVPELSD